MMEYKEGELLAMPEYGKLYKFITMPENEIYKHRMDLLPLNKTGWYGPRENRYWAGKCCYIIKELDDEDFVNVIVCHEMFIFIKNYRVFKTRREYLEEATTTYLISKQKLKLEERNAFLNGSGFKWLQKFIESNK